MRWRPQTGLTGDSSIQFTLAFDYVREGDTRQ